MKRSKVRTRSSSREKGIALVMVLLILTVVTLLGMTIMSIALNNMKMTTGERSYQSAYYIAETGIEITVNEIKNRVESKYKEVEKKYKEKEREYEEAEIKNDFFNGVASEIENVRRQEPFNQFADHFGKKPDLKILISSLDNNVYEIISIGTIDNRTRTLKKEIKVTWEKEDENEKDQESSVFLDKALFVTDFIKLTGGAQIKGKAGTSSSAAGAIKLDGGAGITGDVFIGPDSGDNVIDKPNWMDFNNTVTKLSDEQTFELPEFPSFPTNTLPADQTVKLGSNTYKVINGGNLNIDNYVVDNYTLTMNQNLKFNRIVLNSNYTLNIDVGNQDRNIVVDSLDVVNGKINIIGSGKLTFYVKNKISMSAGSVINNTNSPTAQHIEKLKIYYSGDKLTMSGAQKIYGSLYAKDADLNFTAGSGFQGNIITGGSKINFSGGTNAITQMFYAPNAAVVNSGGGKITGSIIAKSYTGEGGTSLTYGKSTVPEGLGPIGTAGEGGNASDSETSEFGINEGPTLEQ